jgi:hypothetical protein
MLVNEKIQPQKKKVSKFLMSIYSLPFIFVGLTYAIHPSYDMSDNPPNEDNFIMEKMFKNNKFFQNQPKNIEKMNCSTNIDGKRLCLLSMISNNPKRPGELLVIAGKIDDKDIHVTNIDTPPQNIDAKALDDTIKIKDKTIKLPDYDIDFVHQNIHVSNLDKAHYTPQEIYQAVTQEQGTIIKPMFTPITDKKG